MQKTKILFAFVAVAALTLVLVGLASAQIATNQTYTGKASNTANPFNGFLGGIGNCFSYGNSNPTMATNMLLLKHQKMDLFLRLHSIKQP